MFRRAVAVWRRTLPAAITLTVLLVGIPNLVQGLLLQPSTATSAFSTWLHTGHFPTQVLTAPQPHQSPLLFPLQLAVSVVLTPLLYVTLLRLMLGSTIGEELGVRRALTYGWNRLFKTIATSLCAFLVLLAFAIPLGILFVVLVAVHAWKLGVVVIACGFALALATVSLSIAVLLVEDVSGSNATGRSWHLAWRAPGLVGVLTGVLLLGLAVSGGASYLVSHVVPGGAERVTVAVVRLLTGTVVTTITGAFIVSAYVEVRSKVEAEASAGALAFALAAGDPFEDPFPTSPDDP